MIAAETLAAVVQIDERLVGRIRRAFVKAMREEFGKPRAFNDWWCGEGKRAMVAAVPGMKHAYRNEWAIAEAGARVAWESSQLPPKDQK